MAVLSSCAGVVTALSDFTLSIFQGAEAKDKEATKKEVYNRKGSVRSTRSTTSEGVYVKRVGSTPSTSGVFKRQSSSGKSLTSIRTRLTSVRKADYHDDLKPSIEGVSTHIITDNMFSYSLPAC